jgi:hypothetical protein
LKLPKYAITCKIENTQTSLGIFIKDHLCILFNPFTSPFINQDENMASLGVADPMRPFFTRPLLGRRATEEGNSQIPLIVYFMGVIMIMNARLGVFRYCENFKIPIGANPHH